MCYKNINETGLWNVIGPRLKELRNERKITQSEFSKMAEEMNLSISVATICKIEHQRRSVYDYEVRIFAEILNVSIDDFYK